MSKESQDAGEGNWFARYGLVKEWINREEAASRRRDAADEMEEE